MADFEGDMARKLLPIPRLAVLPDREIGLLFEADHYEQIKFARFSLNWLMSKVEGKRRSGSESFRK